MATSGTYAFNPGLGSLSLAAFDLIGVRRAAILQEHLEAARLHANFLLLRWSSAGVNLWQVDLVSTTLVEGQSTYDVDTNTIVILDMYITVQSDSATFDRIIMPVSRTEYASYPNKTQAGFPSVAWFDRTLSPTITIWPVPNGEQTYLKYYRLRQNQDAALQNGLTVEMPAYWMEAFVFGLASRLAIIYAPDRAIGMKAMADEAYDIASRQNIESAMQFISPMLGGYWRV